MLRVATLDDAIEVQERPNMSGTMTDYPNWFLALPQPLEAICRHSLVRKVAEAMGNQIEHKR
jgi:4-alpha-glucanotransferase